ncbi:TetR/AcrR family transcriptional regulator [Arthrobacter sp. efr-133-TYG-118]|uniref:TetR/AcrR family transcriptional regulator n=1 Tax=Arthrobacter sp. efr-133-TYG-118 TaxID=3040279 RepID=UPI00254B1E75|nr:TetR/AcrR family transcriptional regulator [Arthrobacter sp. efr-133-TYG-118]
MTPTDSLTPANGFDTRRRAPALALHERQSMIVDAVVPLLAEHGTDLTSKQISEAAGVAEGTIFRAFGDKETLLRAAAERYFHEDTMIMGLRDIDVDGDLESKLAQVVRLMCVRFTGAIRVVSALDGERPNGHSDGEELAVVVDLIFESDAERLAWKPDRIMHIVRLLSFASSVPEIAGSETSFTPEELARILVHGVTVEEAPTSRSKGLDG